MVSVYMFGGSRSMSLLVISVFCEAVPEARRDVRLLGSASKVSAEILAMVIVKDLVVFGKYCKTECVNG